MLAGNLLPHRFASVLAKADLAVGHRFREENSPAVVGHLEIVEGGPAFGVYGSCGTQVDVRGLESGRTHLVPPLEKFGLPILQRALKPAVSRQTDVVGYSFVVVDRHHTLRGSNSGRRPVP